MLVWFLIIIFIVVAVVACAMIFTTSMLSRLASNGFSFRAINLSDVACFAIKLIKAGSQFRFFSLYIAAMTGLLGWPNIELLWSSTTNDHKDTLNFYIENTFESGTLVIALLITIAYLVYLWRSMPQDAPSYVKEAAKLVNEALKFTPTQSWFNQTSENSIAQLKERYNKDHNVKYPQMSIAMASLQRGKAIVEYFEELERKFLYCFRKFNEKYKEDLKDSLPRYHSPIESLIRNLSDPHFDTAQYKSVKQEIKNLSKFISEDYRTINSQKDPFVYDLREFAQAEQVIENAIDNQWMKTLEHQAIILYGEGGVGKSHLIADLTSHRITEELPTVLLLGAVFTSDDDPFTQLLRLLGINCNQDLFLSGLERYALDNNQRVYFIIDGINEGKGIELWKNHLMNFIQKFKPYPHIGLMLSIRTARGNDWFTQFIKGCDLACIKHNGFEQNRQQAIEEMFNSYHLPIPSWPIYSDELSNPLMLTLYCRSHQLSHAPTEFESKWDVFKNFIEQMDVEIAGENSSDPALKLTIKSLMTIADTMIDSNFFYSLPYDEAVKVVSAATMPTDIHSRFLNILIDKGLLIKLKDSQNNYSVVFGFESLGHYIVAYRLAIKYGIKKVQSSRLLRNIFVTEALATIYPEYKDKELFEDLEGNDRKQALQYFIRTYPYRTTKTKGGEIFIKGLVENKEYKDLFWLILSSSNRCDSLVNGMTLTDMLIPMTISERDFIWTTAISIPGNDLNSFAREMVRWACTVRGNVVRNIAKMNLECHCHLLCWLMCTTDLELRDLATKALTNLIRYRTEIIPRLLDVFSDVNDPYIREDLLAAIFGCTVINNDKELAKEIGLCVYKKILCAGQVDCDFLVRLYASKIVEFAVWLNPDLPIDKEKYHAPYGNTLLPQIPSLAYVNQHYDLPEGAFPSSDAWIANKRIIDSMKTEYSGRGLYGDFGRYVFQSSLDSWPENPEDLSHLALSIIYDELKYDATTFAKFDSHTYYGNDRSQNKVERIGKKYQWTALYKVMAILADVHAGEEPVKDGFMTPAAKAKNLDPTVVWNKFSIPRDATSIFHVQNYDLYKIKNETKWLRAYKKMPPVESYLMFKDQDGCEWVNLFAYSTIHGKPTDIYREDKERDLWTYVNALIVSRDKLELLCHIINKYGLEGRDMLENAENIDLYYREYHWSESYKEEMKMGYERATFSHFSQKEPGVEVEPCTMQYLLETVSDHSIGNNINTLVPSGILVGNLKLRMSDIDGVWIGEDGKAACIDNAFYSDGAEALLIRKNILLRYLQQNNKAIVWQVLIERQVSGSGQYYNRKQSGGYAWIGGEGKLYSKIRLYEDTTLDILRKRMNAKRQRLFKGVNRFLTKHHIKKDTPKNSFEIIFREMADMDD